MLDFPASPTNGQSFLNKGLRNWYFDSAKGVWKRNAGTALRTNLIVNPAMQISQQRGDAAGAGYGYYAADQWVVDNGTTAVDSAQRVQSPTPRGSQYRVRTTITSSNTWFDPSYFYSIWQRLEGNRLADFLWGTAAAQPAVLRFGFKAPAGTYSAAFLNAAPNRSFIMPFTISAGQANIDTEQIFAISGEATGTWPADNTLGATLHVMLGCGSSMFGAAGWNSAAVVATSAITNNLVAGNVFELFDVGLYRDPNNTGLPPEFEVPPVEDDLIECMRYWYKGGHGMRGAIGSANTVNAYTPHPTPMRTTPALSLVGSALRVWQGSVVANCTAVTGSNLTEEVMGINATGAGLTGYALPGGILADGQTDPESNYVAVNARM